MSIIGCKTLTFIVLLNIVIFSQNDLQDVNNISFRNTLYQISYSAKNALLDPITIGTLTLAAGIYFTNSDSRITNWALRNRPIYGSVEKARSASTIFQNSSLILFGLTSLMKNWYLDLHPISVPLYEFTEDISAILLTAALTETIKNGSNRSRPDGSDFRSFPSGHTSFASINMTLASKDISEMNLSKGTTLFIKGSMFLVVAGTAWGRIEGNKHYTSDVLTGAAVGYFFGRLIDNSFNRREYKKREVSMDLNPQHCKLELTLGF